MCQHVPCSKPCAAMPVFRPKDLQQETGGVFTCFGKQNQRLRWKLAVDFGGICGRDFGIQLNNGIEDREHRVMLVFLARGDWLSHNHIVGEHFLQHGNEFCLPVAQN